MKGLIAGLAVLLVLGVAFFFYSSPAPPPAEMTEAEIAQIEADVGQAISARWAGFREGLLAGDIDGMMELWTQDVRLLEPGMDFNRADLLGFITDFVEGGGVGFDFQQETFDLFLHGEVAYQIGQYDEEIQFGGQERIVVQNHFFVRWEKGEDGVWRISRFHAAPREAPPEG
jgi:ketosteroid isomerase-like protein